MAAALTHLRRLVASLMLAAMASFVMHGVAMAGLHPHNAGTAGCGSAAAHSHQAQVHDHGDGIVHMHAEQAVDTAAHDHRGSLDHHAGSSDGPCCSSVCSVTLAMPGVDVVSAPMRLARTLQPQSQVGSGIDQGGLKRPPRTPAIA